MSRLTDDTLLTLAESAANATVETTKIVNGLARGGIAASARRERKAWGLLLEQLLGRKATDDDINKVLS